MYSNIECEKNILVNIDSSNNEQTNLLYNKFYKKKKLNKLRNNNVSED